VIRNGTIVTDEEILVGDVACRDGLIAEIGPDLPTTRHDEIVDASGQFVFPGGLDPHVHLSLPLGGTVSADDFENGGYAAVAGGTTSFLDFVTPQRHEDPFEAFVARREEAHSCPIDYGFHVAITRWDEDTVGWMRQCVFAEGIASFKVFLAYRETVGIDDADLFRVLQTAARLGAVVAVHAENGEVIRELQLDRIAAGETGPEFHAQSRPAPVEGEATARALMIARITGAELYIVHMTCEDSVRVLRDARNRGQAAWGETCPQYLLLDDSVYRRPGFEGAAFVMSPPIRPRGHQAALWAALTEGVLSTVGTDHCPFTQEQKEIGRDDFRLIPNGGAGIQDRMSLLWHYGVGMGRFDERRFVALTSSRAARIFRLWPRKGAIRPGSDADLVVWDPDGTRILSAATHLHANDRSLYEGLEVRGVPSSVVVGGRLALADGELRIGPGDGRFLERTTAIAAGGHR
jgi:dihydropyrimidinase